MNENINEAFYEEIDNVAFNCRVKNVLMWDENKIIVTKMDSKKIFVFSLRNKKFVLIAKLKGHRYPIEGL